MIPKRPYGFTFIELMMVVSTIGVLAAMAIPAYTVYMKRAKVVEALTLGNGLAITMTDYYSFHGKLPDNNQTLALPQPAELTGRYVNRMQIENGAIHITFANDPQLENLTLTLRPALVATYPPTSYLTWVCGYAKAVPGMTLVGTNKTTVPPQYLPQMCL